MQIISVVLLLISIGLVVGPVGAVVYIYRDDLTGLVLPPEINGIMNGDASFILNDNVNSVEGDGYTDSFLDSFVAPTFVSATVDYASRTFTVTVNVTNSLNYDLTLNRLSAQVDTSDLQQLATVSVGNPITIPAGESALVTVDGFWTQVGEAYIVDSYGQSASISLTLVNLLIDVNGVTVELDGPINIGNIPLSLEGVNFTG